MAIHQKSDSELLSHLWCDPQELQNTGICGGLVGVFLGQPAFHRVTIYKMRFFFVAIADFHMGFVKGRLLGHSQKSAYAPFLYHGIAFQRIKLFFAQALKGAMGPSSGLTEGIFLYSFVDGQCNGEKRGKKHSCQCDGQDSHDVPRPAGQKKAQTQTANAALIGNFHLDTSSPCDNAPILNADDTMGHLCNFFVVGDHHHGLSKFLPCHFHQTEHILACLAVQVAGGFVGQ